MRYGNSNRFSTFSSFSFFFAFLELSFCCLKIFFLLKSSVELLFSLLTLIVLLVLNCLLLRVFFLSCIVPSSRSATQLSSLRYNGAHHLNVNTKRCTYVV